MLLSGASTAGEAVRLATEAGLNYDGSALAVVATFKYLGITFSASGCLAAVKPTPRARTTAAAEGRTAAARAAHFNCLARCAELGIEAAPVRLRLFSTMVDSVLSYGSEVWATKMAAAAAAGSSITTGSAPEVLHLTYLRQLLGVRRSTPNAATLAETGERPLWVRWLQRAAQLWNRVLAAPAGSLLRQAAAASTQQPDGWARQLAAALDAVGLPIDLNDPQPVPRGVLRKACTARQLEQTEALAARETATKHQNYVRDACGGELDAATLWAPEAYLLAVRERCRRRALAQLRTSSHWGAEETGRWHGVPRPDRVCPHCNQHMLQRGCNCCYQGAAGGGGSAAAAAAAPAGGGRQLCAAAPRQTAILCGSVGLFPPAPQPANFFPSLLPAAPRSLLTVALIACYALADA